MHLVRCVSELSHISLPQFPASKNTWQQPTIAMITKTASFTVRCVSFERHIQKRLYFQWLIWDDAVWIRKPTR